MLRIPLSRRALGAALTVPLLVPALARAQGASKVFNACYVPGTGTVYRIREAGLPQECAAGHVAFSWADATTTAAGTNGNGGGGATYLKVGDAAGGDLSGTFPSPTVSKLSGRALSTVAPTGGQVLQWNAGSSVWEPATPASGGVTAHWQLTGLTSDDHKQYLIAGGNRAANDGFAVSGVMYSGVIAAQGAGTRVLWYPTKSVFRAGTVDAGQWDPGNSGPYSTAFGYNTIANGTAATALGWITSAGGAGALAAGRSSIASGASAMALGENVQATGTYAIAAGTGSVASGQASVALGNATASGNYAVALGQSTASGAWSFAAGQNATADAAGSVVIGTAATSFGKTGSFVFGDGTGGASAVYPSAANQFVARASGGVAFYTNTALTSGVTLAPGAGSWSNLSDVNKKTDFRAIDGDAVLDRLARMDIREWRYKSQDASIRHVGPTAQDFRHAFGLGENETTINTVDADGISLLGVQALTRRLARQQDEIAALYAALDRLEARLARAESDAGRTAAPRRRKRATA